MNITATAKPNDKRASTSCIGYSWILLSFGCIHAYCIHVLGKEMAFVFAVVAGKKPNYMVVGGEMKRYHLQITIGFQRNIMKPVFVINFSFPAMLWLNAASLKSNAKQQVESISKPL